MNSARRQPNDVAPYRGAQYNHDVAPYRGAQCNHDVAPYRGAQCNHDVAPYRGAQYNHLEQVLETILATRKYRSVHPNLARSIAAAELAKGRSVKDAIKAAKRQLHQSAAAYFRQTLSYDQSIRQLQAAVDSGDDESVRSVLRHLMAAHTSTQERLPLLDTLYSELFQRLPPVKSVLDVACGLHPLARPWMPLPPDLPYIAWDIFADQIDFLNRFFRVMGYAGTAAQRNALEDLSAPAVDMAFILKTLPCLEQIESGAGQRLLYQIDAPLLIVSFPNHSLAGRKKGMRQYYAAYFDALIADAGWQMESLAYRSEQVYIVRKRAMRFRGFDPRPRLQTPTSSP